MTGLAAAGAARSETGRVRDVNEDRTLLCDRAGRGAALYAVADGLGGHAGGGVASETAIRVLREQVPAALAAGAPPAEALVLALRRADAAIRGVAGASARTGMATTCTAVLVRGRAAVIAHVGDSRAHLIRGREVSTLTTDHSLVADLVRRGDLAPSQAAGHTKRHVLTRALGVEPDAAIDVLPVSLRGGDVLVLTTDGLHAAVTAEEMAAVIRDTPDRDEACRLLVRLAEARGGADNASAVIVRLAPRWAGRIARAALPAALALLLAAGFAAYRLAHSYFLGVRGGQVAVMRGVPARVLGVPLWSVVEVTPARVAQIPPAYRGRLRQGVPARTPQDARSLLEDLLRRP